MSILIKGMEMPTNEPLIVKINPDGSVNTTWKNDYKKYEAVPVPEHGRLIDADALPTYDKPIGKMMMFGGEYVYTQTAIDNAPTIIPASAADKEGEG